MANPVCYIVEGANFVAYVPIDEEIFTNDGTRQTSAYVEAVTRTLEYIFRHGPDTADDFDLRMKEGEEPAVGIIMSVCKDGEIGDPDKLQYIKTSSVCQNAGCLEILRHFENSI